MLNFFRDQRASSGSIAFSIIVIILIVMLVQFIEPINIAFSELILTLAYKKGLDSMQQAGCLTTEIRNDIVKFLKKYGFEEEKIIVDGTRTPVDWGENIGIEIGYSKEYKVYNIEGIMGIKSKVETINLLVEGSTTSYYFDNN